MSVPKDLLNQIHSATVRMIELGLCNEQNFAALRQSGNDEFEITIANAAIISIALKNIEYANIYNAMESAGAFNMRMLDGALVQLHYRVRADQVVSHRLAFFPAPSLAPFQNEPELYEEDEIYADILSRSVVQFPMRFDFDSSDDLYVEVDHPKSHLTLGQYENCRIPVSGPVPPITFLRFLLRHFYNHAARRYDSDLPMDSYVLAEIIGNKERLIPYLSLRHQG
jgi:hypothetical protein